MNEAQIPFWGFPFTVQLLFRIEKNKHFATLTMKVIIKNVQPCKSG